MNVKLVIFQYFPLFLSTVESYIEIDLREYLFKNYSSYISPIKDQGTAVIVTFNMKLIQLISVEERNQKITTQAYYAMRCRN